MRAKCSRCKKNPVTRPAYICATCAKAPKKRRTNRATARPSYRANGGVAGALALLGIGALVVMACIR